MPTVSGRITGFVEILHSDNVALLATMLALRQAGFSFSSDPLRMAVTVDLGDNVYYAEDYSDPERVTKLFALLGGFATLAPPQNEIADGRALGMRPGPDRALRLVRSAT